MTPRDYSPLREYVRTHDTVRMKAATVNELLDELDALRKAALVKVGRKDYPGEFEKVWEIYPSRPGDSKKAACKAWLTRVKAGATEADILAGTIAYAAYVVAMKVEPNFIKQAATFFGPGEHYAADWTVPEIQPKKAAVAAWWTSDASILAKGAELGLRPHAGEPMPNFKGRIQAAIDNGGTAPPPARTEHIVPRLLQEDSTGRRAKPEGMGSLRDMVKRVALPLSHQSPQNNT